MSSEQITSQTIEHLIQEVRYLKNTIESNDKKFSKLLVESEITIGALGKDLLQIKEPFQPSIRQMLDYIIRNIEHISSSVDDLDERLDAIEAKLNIK